MRAKMYVRGVSREGKRINLFDAFSIKLPYGAVYSNIEDGGYSIQMLATIPLNYQDGEFPIPDDVSLVWAIFFESGPITYEYVNIPVSKATDCFKGDVKNIAETIAGKSNKDTSQEELIYSRTIKCKNKYSYKHTLTFTMDKGGINEVFEENNLAIYRSIMKIQIGAMGSVSCNWILAGTLDYPNATIYRGQLKVDGNMEKVFCQSVAPILRTIKSLVSTPKIAGNLTEIVEEKQAEEGKRQKQEEEYKQRAREKIQEELRIQE